MANPPFNIDPTIPQDTGIVSQYPLQERTMRDNMKSWLLVDHDITTGRHAQVSINQLTPDPVAGPSGTSTIMWLDTTGQLKHMYGGTGAGGPNVAEFVGVPPGAGLPFFGATLPAGFLWANGAAVSRTTYARLFAALGTTYGAGDGSTTFNVPNTMARILVARDTMGGAAAVNLVTTGGSGINATVLGTTGGFETVVLVQANLPNVTFSGNHNHTINYDIATAAPGGQTIIALLGSGGSLASTNTTVLNVPSGGTNTPHQNMPPSLVCNFIIKY